MHNRIVVNRNHRRRNDFVWYTIRRRMRNDSSIFLLVFCTGEWVIWLRINWPCVFFVYTSRCLFLNLNSFVDWFIDVITWFLFLNLQTRQWVGFIHKLWNERPLSFWLKKREMWSFFYKKPCIIRKQKFIRKPKNFDFDLDYSSFKSIFLCFLIIS